MNSITQSSKSELASILILTSSYPKYLGEPSGIFLHLLSKYLSAQGWRLTVLAPNFPGGKKTFDESIEETIDKKDFIYLSKHDSLEIISDNSNWWII